MTASIILIISGMWAIAASYPVMFAPPLLGPPTIINGGHDFTQTCHINYQRNATGAAFLVTWIFDDVIYKTVTLKNYVFSTSLNSSDWKPFIGKSLSCSVESFLTTNPNSYSPSTRSNMYLGTLKIPEYPIRQTEGQEAFLSVKSTLPLICPGIPPSSCRLDFNIEVIKGDPKKIFLDKGCIFSLKAEDWDTHTHSVETSKQISSPIDPHVKSHGDHVLKFTQGPRGPALFDSFASFEVKYSYQDARHSFCILSGASQFVVQSDRMNTMHHYRVGDRTGDLLLYRSKKMEVQSRHWRPVGGMSMVCGVAFRYDRTLIKVDMCSSDPVVTAPVLLQGQHNPDDVTVYQCGDIYEVVTSDDTRLSVALHSDHLDLKLHVPVPSFNQGACFFRLSNSVLPKHLYSVSESESLFGHAAAPFFQVSPEEVNSPHYCTCGVPGGYCHPFRALADPSSPIFYNSTGQQLVRDGCTVVVPRSRDVAVLPPHLISSSGVASTNFHSQIANRAKCEAAIRYHSSTFCISNNHIMFNVYRERCIQEAVSTDDVNLGTASAAIGFNWYCQEHTLSTFNHYTHDIRTGEYLPAPEVTSDMCSGVCSLAGSCYHGMCACEKGFSGVDCSVNSTSVPVIVGIMGGKSCGLSSEGCHDITLITRNVYPDPHLSVNVSISDDNSPPQYLTIEPVYENKYSLSLHIQHTISTLAFKDNTVMRLRLSITNDGQLFSQPVHYTIYDDKCRLCGATNECLYKEDACHIDGECYVANELNPKNKSEMCDPDEALLRWTKVQAHLSNPTVR